MTEPSAATLVDAETIDMWRREHEYTIEVSVSGSYAAHVSQQMLMALDALAVARHAQQQAEALMAAVEKLTMELWSADNDMDRAFKSEDADEYNRQSERAFIAVHALHDWMEQRFANALTLAVAERDASKETTDGH